MTKKPCGKVDDTFGGEDFILTCDLPAGHPGPVHQDGDHAWPDMDLPLPQ